MLAIMIDLLATFVEASGFLYIIKSEKVSKNRVHVFALLEIGFAFFNSLYSWFTN